MLTYMDSGILIALTTQNPPRRASQVANLLGDPNRTFVSSDVLKIEVFPKPTFFRETFSILLLKNFFSICVKHIEISQDLYQKAYAEACKGGLSGMDALHIVSAHEAGAVELITTEKPTKAMYQTTLVKVRHIDSI
jgi:predicted nucleic acid-binding protein